MFAAVKRCLFRNLKVRESIRTFSVPDSSNTISPIAYGESDFGMIRRGGSWYVDKTHFLPTLEAMGRRLFFVRPPRFGKTLLLSMMQHYYDVNNKNNFDELFGGLWIHQNPTKLRTSFYILHLAFGISVDDKVESNFFDRINRSVELSCEQYGLSAQNIVNKENALDSVLALASKFKGRNFMVLIDEYDRFANSLMFDKPQMYDKVVRGQSGDPASSALRSFLTTLKQLPNDVSFSEFRSFMTGITPLVLADASGYNVARNITLHEDVGDLAGLKGNDIEDAIDKYLPLERGQRTGVLDVMQSYYDGYYFPGCEEPLYNSTLVSYFLNEMFRPKFRDYIFESKSINPNRLYDSNTKVSDKVLNLISQVPSSADIVYRLSNEQVETNVMEIHENFNLQEMLHPPEDDVYAHDRSLSFLFYHGVTTMKSGEVMTEPVPLRAPNKLAKIDFIDRLKKVLSLPEKLLYDVEIDPNKETVHALLKAIIEKQQSLFDNSLSEGGLQHMIEAALRAQFRGRVCLGIEEPVTTGRSDIRIKFEDKVVVIELKRVRLNALSPPPELKAGHPLIRKATNWHPIDLEILINYLKEQTNDVLYKYEIRSDFHRMYDVKSVSEILKAGCCQVKEYMTHISKENPNNTCYAFVVVQVGFPLIVEQVH